MYDFRKDTREWVYSRADLEKGLTHDDLWNAAQNQLVREGKMHGFLRMYWAKKILEWTAGPEVALADSIYLNDKYALDGLSPNGYVGKRADSQAFFDYLYGNLRLPNTEFSIGRLHVVNRRHSRYGLEGASDFWQNSLHEL